MIMTKDLFEKLKTKYGKIKETSYLL